MFHYLKTFSLVVAVQFIIAVCFNLLVDPYGAWHNIRIHGFNALKPKQIDNQRIFKMGAWNRQPTSWLILGTSRAFFGLDPSHSGFTEPVYNLAMYCQSVEESQRLLAWASKKTQLRLVILATDFFSANMFYNPYPIQEQYFSFFGRLMSAASMDTTLSSIKTIDAQASINKFTSVETGTGFINKTSYEPRPNHRQNFLDTHWTYLIEYYFPKPNFQFSFSDNEKNIEDFYRYMFALSHKNAIDFHILISPIQAQQLEVLNVIGLGPLREEWLRIMVKVNEEEAALAGKAPFPLWDFSGFNSLTTEEVPALGDTETRMKWYWESSHYKKELGDLVLDRVLDYSSPNRKVPADFGVLLDSKMLEAHLNQVRIDRDVWRKSHPEDVKEIAEMAAKAEAKRAFMKAKKKVPTAR